MTREIIIAEIMKLVRPHPTRREKPTIAELEAILNSETKDAVDINPDGSISARPSSTTVGAVADAILAALPCWQPIETAPKDRTWILGFESRIGMNDKYTPHEVMRWVDFGLSDRGAHWRNSMNNLCQPTHWMPLPAAPQAQVAVTAGDAT